MISVNEIRIKRLIEQYLHRIGMSNMPMDSNSIDRLVSKGKAHDPFYPTSGHYRAAPLEPLDVDGFNAELDTLVVDQRTISDVINSLYENIRERILLNEITSRIYENKSKKVITDAVYLTADKFIEGFTTELDFKKDIDHDASDIVSGGGGLMIHTKYEQTANMVSYNENSVSVVVSPYAGVPDINNMEPEIKGRKASIIDRSFDNGITVTVYSLLSEMITITIKCNVSVRNANSILVTMDEPDHGQVVRLAIEDQNSKKTTVFEGLHHSDRIMADMEHTDVRFLYITISQKLPNFSIGGVNGYVFNIRKAKLSDTMRKQSATAITNPIPIRGDTRFITLVADEVIPENTIVDYYVSQVKDDNGNPTNFTSLVPTSREGQNIQANYLSIGTKRKVQPIQCNTETSSRVDWRYIIPEKKYGGRLYPILNLPEVVQNFDDITIDEDSMKLYRGINDWSLTREKLVRSIVHRDIVYKPKYNDDTSGYESVPIYISTTEEVRPVNAYTFELSYQIVKIQDYVFTDRDFRKMEFQITNFEEGEVDGKYRITVDRDDLVETDVYHLTYYIKLEDVTTSTTKILREDTALRTSGGILAEGIDYQIVDTPEAKRIQFRRGGSYDGEDIVASFHVEEEELKEAVVYSTTIIATRNVILNIGPFNKAEIERGNYHIIDGEDVSRRTAYVMSAGSHTIQSTQVDPGMNQFTGINSSAFIRIPFQEVEMRGFEASMRKVPVYDLVLNSGIDHRPFSYVDGIVYINRVPDFSVVARAESNGRYLKTTRVLSTGEVETVPEEFRLEFNYDDGTAVNEIFLKVRLTNDDPVVQRTPEVKKIGINQYNVDIEQRKE